MSVEDKARFGRACLLVLDKCPPALRRVIEHQYTTHGFSSFEEFLNDWKNKHDLFHLRFQKCCLVHCMNNNKHTVLYTEQWDLLYNETSPRNPHKDRGKCPCMYTAIPGVTTDVMDITLCCLLLKNICRGVSKSLIDDICAVRKQILHTGQPSLDEKTFDDAWKKIEHAMLSFAASISTTYQTELQTSIQETRSGFCDLSNMESLLAHERHIESLQEVLDSTLKKQDEINRRVTTLEKEKGETADTVTTLAVDMTRTMDEVAGIKRTISDQNQQLMDLSAEHNKSTSKTLNHQKEKVLQALLKINTRATEKILISPLQNTLKTTDFDNIYVPPIVREDLEKEVNEKNWSEKVEYLEKKPKHKGLEINDPKDLFYKNGETVRYIFLRGEAGHGKTVYCQNLVRQWCRAKQRKDEKNGLSVWEKGLNEFDFVFMIMLRHVNKSRTSLVDMICFDLFKHFGSCHEDIKRLINCDNCRSLFIIDGLDEWKIPFEIREKLVNEALPDIECTSNCTFLFTYRPWKHSEIAREIQSCDRVIDIRGFDEQRMKIAIENVLKALDQKDSSKEAIKRKTEEIIKEYRASGLISILVIPLLVPLFILLIKEGKLDEESITGFYIRLVQFLIKLAIEKKTINNEENSKIVEHSCENIVVPCSLELSRYKIFREFLPTLTKLGEISYNDLISRESSLVFVKEDLEDTLGTPTLEFGLKVGLLNQSQAPGCFDVENVSLNFLHKSVQEFLAATYLVCHERVAIESFCGKLTSIKVILEHSELLKFVSGLSPSFGCLLSRHIVDVCDHDEEVTEWRLNPELVSGSFFRMSESYYQMCSIFNLQYRCFIEMRNCNIVHNDPPNSTLHSSKKKTKRDAGVQDNFHVAHAIDPFTNSPHIIKDLLDDPNVNIVGLFLNYLFELLPFMSDNEIEMFQTSLNHFLKRTESLRYLALLPSRRKISMQGINKNLSLRSIVLKHVNLSSTCLHHLVESVKSSRQLQSLILENVNVVDDVEINSKNEVIYRREKSVVTKCEQTNRKLFSHKLASDNKLRTLVDLLQILPYCPRLYTLHIDRMSLKDPLAIKALLGILPKLNDLRNITFDGEIIIILFPYDFNLVTSLSNQQTLKGNENSVVENITDTILGMSQLQVIDLSSVSIKEDSIVQMFKMPKLQNLKLNMVKLNKGCMKNILQLPQLQYLSLFDMELPEQFMCVDVIAPNLRELSFTECSDMCLEVTPECKMLREINLANINMSEIGWRRFFLSLHRLDHEIYIKIRLMTMSAECCISLVDTVTKLNQRIDVDLDCVMIDDESVKMITACQHLTVTKNENLFRSKQICFHSNAKSEETNNT